MERGGAYAALVLEEYNPPETRSGAEPESLLFVISGLDAAALRRRLEQLRGLAATELQEVDLPRLAATLRGLDADFPERIAVIAGSCGRLASALERALALPAPAGRIYGDPTLAANLAAEAEAWVAGAAIGAGPPLPPLRLPPYPFDHDARFALQAAESGDEDLVSRILAGDLTEDDFALMVQS